MEEEIKWQAFEYEYKARTADWYWVVWIIAIGITVTAYLFNNLLFSIFILVSAFSVSVYASRKPDLLEFKLSKENFFIKGKKIPLTSLKSFWIEDNKKIILQSKSKVTTYLIIPLSETVDTKQLKDYLLNKLEEEEHQESIFQKLFEKLGF